MKFSIKDFFSNFDQIRSSAEKFLMENFIFCAVFIIYFGDIQHIHHVLLLTTLRS